MKCAIVTLLAMTSSVATVAVAQDGNGHGPPNSPIIVLPQPTTGPTLPWPRLPLPQLSQPAPELPPTVK